MKKLICIGSLVSALLLPAGLARATAQIPDLIVIEGESYPLQSEPLEPYLRNHPNVASGLALDFISGCTASWRGYRATWEIVDSKLYLVRINSQPCGKNPPVVPLKRLFPNDTTRRVADWYTGVIKVAQGNLVKSIYGGYSSKYERYLTLTIVDGIVTKEERHDVTEELRQEEARWQEYLAKTKKSRQVQDNEKLD